MRKFTRLYRARVTALLENAIKSPLTVISGEAGSGKTTAVLQYIQQRQESRPLIFRPEIGNGTEEERFASFANTLKLYDGSYQKLLAGMTAPLTRAAAHRLVAVLCKQITSPTLFVFDLQEFSCDHIFLQFIDELLLNRPPKLQIILVQRPALTAIDQYIERGICTALTSRDFLFNLREMRQIMQLHGMKNNLQNAEKYLSATCGWPQAVRELIETWEDEGEDDGSLPNLHTLWEGWLTSRLNSTEIRLMLRMCYLHGLTVEQAVKLWGVSAVGETLRRLYERRAYIEFDKKTGVYSPKPFICQYLLSLSDLLPEEIEHDRIFAAQMYAEEGRPADAFDLFVRARAYSRALNTYRLSMTDNELAVNYPMIAEAMELIPLRTRIAHRSAYLNFIFKSIICYSPENGTALLWEAKQAFEEYESDAPDYGRIEAELKLLEAALSDFDIDLFVSRFKEAYQRFAGDSTIQSGIDEMLTCGTASILPHFVSESGRLKDNFDKLFGLSDIISDLVNDTAYAMHYVLEAEYAIETADYDKAQELSVRAMQLCANYRQDAFFLVALQTHCRVLIARGLFEDALMELLSVEEWNVTRKSPALMQARALLVARMMVHMGYRISIRGIDGIDSLRFPASRTIGLIITTLADMDYGLEDKILRSGPELDRAENETDRLIYRLHILIMRAVSKLPVSFDEALKLYKEAVELARPDHLVQILIEQTQFTYSLLERAMKDAPDDELLKEIHDKSAAYYTRVLGHRAQQRDQRRVLNKNERAVMEALLGNDIGRAANVMRVPVVTIASIAADCMEYYGVLSLKEAVDMYRDELQKQKDLGYWEFVTMLADDEANAGK